MAAWAGQRMERTGGYTYFVHTDHLGSTRAVTDSAGNVADAIDYLPYGEQIAGDTDLPPSSAQWIIRRSPVL